jgi:hypothetical protein
MIEVMDELDRKRLERLYLEPMGIDPQSDEAEALFAYLAAHGFSGYRSDNAFLSPIYRQELQHRIGGFIAGWRAAEAALKQPIRPFPALMRRSRRAAA